MSTKTNLKIYLLSQQEQTGYDTYDSCVVIAASPKTAKRIHPSSHVSSSVYKWHEKRQKWVDGNEKEHWTNCAPWANHINNVQVKLIGTAKTGSKAGTVVCASFNAG